MQASSATPRTTTNVASLLVRTILRMCGAMRGVEPALDNHLDRIKDTITAGYSPEWTDQLGRLTRELAQAADERAALALLPKLLRHAGLSSMRRERALGLWRELAGESGAASDSQLDELAASLGLASSLAHQAGRSDEPVVRGSDTDLLVTRLLERVEWPEAVAGELAQLRTLLDKPGAGVDVAEPLGQLIATTITEARQDSAEASQLLRQLDRQLRAIEGYLSDESGRREHRAGVVGDLENQVRADVGNLKQDLKQHQDLAQMTASVAAGLGRIQKRVDGYTANENAALREATARERELRDGLAQLEKERAELREKLANSSAEARCDFLTGLPNRRAFDERIAQEHARFRRFREPLSLMLIDIDHFKKVNDVHGHSVGDRVLQQLAECLSGSIRTTDFVARYGGEEFVMIMVGTDRAGAYIVAEKVRWAVEQSIAVAGKPITLSAGLSMFTDGDDVDAVIERADQALYKAKAAGRNRCIMI